MISTEAFWDSHNSANNRHWNAKLRQSEDEKSSTMHNKHHNFNLGPKSTQSNQILLKQRSRNQSSLWNSLFYTFPLFDIFVILNLRSQLIFFKFLKFLLIALNMKSFQVREVCEWMRGVRIFVWARWERMCE